MVAKITFKDGGIIFPVRTPYDRQLLQEHVLYHLSHSEQLQITLGRQNWVVKRTAEAGPLQCKRCKRQLTIAALHATGNTAPFCVKCALS